MNNLGIYFGPKVISLVESKGKQHINNAQIPQSAISGSELAEEKVPEEIKTATLLKNELIKKKIEARDATLILSGKDLIIRSFEMPIMPSQELAAAINFEIKKYIPFKLEELVSDNQWILDKSSRKIYALFTGIKKEVLDKYLFVLNKSGLSVKSAEYAAFSILRLFKLVRFKEKGIISVVAVDAIKNDEANFVILENGFPLFSRDITSIGEIQEETKLSEEERLHAVLEKLRREVIISLEYYERKFIGKTPSKIFFIINPSHKTHLDMFKDTGLEIHFMDINKYIDASIPFSLPLVKAYSGSLLKVSAGLRINILLAKEKPSQKIKLEQLKALPTIIQVKSNLKVAAVCLLICIMIYSLGGFRSLPFKKDLNKIIGMRPKVSTISPDANYEELANLYSQYREKIKTFGSLVKRQFYLTELLDVIPRLIPEGIWLENLSFDSKREENKSELILEGIAYLGDGNKEIALVDTFFSRLKEVPFSAKHFNEMSITSLDRKQTQKEVMTSFVISCKNY